MQFDFEAGVWAVAGCGGKKYIGKLRRVDTAPNHAVLDDAVELVVMLMPMQTPQGPALNRVTTCQPIDGCGGPTSIEIELEYLHLFSAMKPGDRKRHESIVQNGLAQMTEASAREAGLVIPRVRPV